MRVFVYPIKLKSHRDKFPVYLGGDLHYGDPNCDEDAWKRLIDSAKNDKPNTKVVLMGDYIYSFPKDDRRNWGLRPKHGSVIDLYSNVRDSIIPIKNRVVTCLSGNHDEDWMKSENIDFVNWMCAELGIPHGGYESYIRFKVTVDGDCDSRRNVDLLVWHGAGGGRTVGGAMNRARSPIDAFRKPNVVAMGHLHRIGMTHEQWMDIDEDRLDVVETDQYFILTGGYQRGYSPPDSSYISRQMLAPVAIGGIKLIIQPFKNVGDKDKLDIQIEEVR